MYVIKILLLTITHLIHFKINNNFQEAGHSGAFQIIYNLSE